MCDLVISEGKLYLRGSRQEMSQAAQIPGAKRDREFDCYTVGLTLAAAEAAIEIVGDERTSGEVHRFVADAKAQAAKARKAKLSENLPQPKSKAPSWLHQLRAYHFIGQLQAAALFMDMGTGKSKVVVDHASNTGKRRVLIVCPKSVIPSWPDQFERYAAVEWGVCILEGTPAQKMQRLRDVEGYAGRAVVITNYESVWREGVSDLVKRMGWDLVVLDESHRIKSAGSRVSKFFYELGKRMKNKLLLTGTPMSNSPLDIYGQFRFLDPTIFGTNYKAFQLQYAVMGGFNGHQVLKYKNLEQLSAKVDQHAYRVKAEDVLDLPPFTHVTRYCQMSSEALRVHRELRKDMVAELGGKLATAAIAGVRILRLQQISSGYLPLDEGAGNHHFDNTKRTLLIDTLEDLPLEPIVVFCNFHYDLDAIKSAATVVGSPYFELSGRKNELAKWKESKRGLLAVQIQSGGSGIDLTKARYFIYYSVGYDLAAYEQSLKRGHRPGQLHHTTYIHLLAEKSIDKTVYGALQEKTDIVKYVMGRIGGEA